MRQRTLDMQTPSGDSPLTTSAIGLGCMGRSQGYGPVDEQSAVKVIHQAIERGITMFDTAMSYGDGDNERLLARALTGRRDTVRVATKIGIVRDEHGVHLDGRPEHVGPYCDASLQRLETDYIDLYYLHRADPQVPVEETIGAMGDLVTAGKVRHLGVSELTVEHLQRAAHTHPITALQLEWSLLWRQPESDLIPEARRLGIGLVPYSPLGRGLLTSTLDQDNVDTSAFRRNDPRFHGEALTANQRQVRALAGTAGDLGISPGQLALAWLLAQGEDVVPIPGTRDPDRVGENAAAAEIDAPGATRMLAPLTRDQVHVDLPDADFWTPPSRAGAKDSGVSRSALRAEFAAAG